MNLTKNTSSSFSTLSSLDDDIQIYLLLAIHTIEITRYLIAREIISKSTNIIDICLNINCYKRLQEFCQYVCMSFQLFTLLVEKLKTQPIFRNASTNLESQIVVERQLLTTLICMGSYINASSLTKIGDLCRIGKGTVDKICR